MVAETSCARSLYSCWDSSSHLQRMGPDLFVDVLSRALPIKVACSWKFGNFDVVTKYCSVHNKDELSKHAFEEITSDEILPEVGFFAAIIDLLYYDVEAVVRKGKLEKYRGSRPPLTITHSRLFRSAVFMLLQRNGKTFIALPHPT